MGNFRLQMRHANPHGKSGQTVDALRDFSDISADQQVEPKTSPPLVLGQPSAEQLFVATIPFCHHHASVISVSAA
jgi:hypothetical protein